MSDDQRFLVPDYFPDFSCKMGKCRKPCCEGWPITVSMTDYFRLLSVDCSPELRRKLDGAMHLAPHPTQESYAQISPRYDGQCPLHLPDGRCALHAELGDELLSAVCRLYPRGVRQGDALECSCANSCEAVLEQLLHHEAPLRFIPTQLHFALPPAAPRQHYFHTAGREQDIRLWLIAQLQRRDLPLPQRILLLGSALMSMDEALTQQDEARVARLLNGTECIPVPETIHPGHDQLLSGLTTVEAMLAIMDEGSKSIRDFGEAVLSYFGQGEEAFTRYQQASAHFAALLPQWESWFEHMLINHMFFVQFPFQDRPVPLKDEYLALCAVYTLLRFLCVGWTALHPSESAAVDAAAAAFRLIDHTDFDRYAAPILKKLGCDDRTHLRQILCL
ncbi:MAG: flagellin lysine-N-methylase [Clostridia bacterium]|nr:flagellin lysine-N-methylase [Clostridia bacterium]